MMTKMEVKAISSLKKVLLTDNFYDLVPLKSLKAAKGERVSFQLALKNLSGHKRYASFKVCDEFAKYTTLSNVGHVPVKLFSYSGHDENYLSKAPGLFPDVLLPVDKLGHTISELTNTNTVWVSVELPRAIKAGKHTFTVEVTSEGEPDASTTVSVEFDIKKTVMPTNDLVYTRWFHCDCIADYYGVPMMSKKHWQYIEQFIKTAAKTGITMLLTPIFTPPLDTLVGAERPTMQLVKVKKSGDKYEFDFELLDKWVKLCHKHGIRYFEISHLFTQWGAGFCPKIVVNVDGEDKKLFGWHTESTGDMYKDFLSQLLPALTSHLKELGIADNCYFHISDEPKLKEDKPDFENYKAAKEFLKGYLEGFKIIDALSQIEFYDSGLVDIPVPSVNHIEPFLERDIDERWCYYCCSQFKDVSNSFIAMPAARTRILGSMMFLYDMKGFLQWGYNFYYSERSRYLIDPYRTTDGDSSWPAGDPFIVYPYNGEVLESIRSKVFYDAIQDRMLFKALADKIGLDEAKKLILDEADGMLTFSRYPTDEDFITRVHDKVLDILG